MELDVKTILIAILIITICILICFGGFKTMEKEEIVNNIATNFSLVQNTTNTQNTSGSRIEKIENTIENSFISSNTMTENTVKVNKIEKNNTSPMGDLSVDYVKREVDYSRMGGRNLYYKIPSDWNQGGMIDKDPVTGADVDRSFLKLSEFGEYSEETTYAEFLNDFIAKEKRDDFYSDYIDFRTRDLVIDQFNTLTIIEKIGAYAITSYVVLVQADGVYWVTVTVSKDDYNDEFTKKVDQILSTVCVGIG